MIIAIDGPSASGKGTLAKRVAKHLGLPYLNTGALYRAVGMKVLLSKVDFNDIEGICSIAKKIKPKDLESNDLYTEEVGFVASKVASIQKVRDILLAFQKDFAYNMKGAVLDGRDIGTVICPNADYKFFITASVEERAMRRYKELADKDKDVLYEEILQKLKTRDKMDSERANSPLKKADDAIEVDTTKMNREEVLNYVLSFVEQKELE